MTRKNLDYIILKFADSKAFMLESLQVSLAYHVRKMIKRKKLEAIERKKNRLREKKRIEREKEAARQLKIHLKRKVKKKDVKAMV